MYAIIRTGGHQEKVTVGEQITVDRLKEEPGDTISFVPLMVSLDDGSIVTDHSQLTDKAGVTARVVQHIKADKVEVFQYRQKSNYRRHTGHRQPMTLIEISELKFGTTVEKIDEKRAAEEAQRQALELEKQAQAEADKDAPKKVTPKKKTAAKASGKSAAKPAAKKSAAKKSAKKKEG
ncbi:MAG: 50S ribosomal protein L21 [Actinomycetota bacterium]